MFERDHGPLEYQKAKGKAMEHITVPYPRHLDLSCRLSQTAPPRRTRWTDSAEWLSTTV